MEGKALTVTTMKFGDGTLPTTQTEIVALSALADEKQSFRVNSVQSDGTYTKVKAVVTNESLDSGYYIRECGLYCLDSTTGKEVLIAVEKTDEQYIPAKSNQLVSFIQTMILTLGDATITISAENDAYQLKEEALTFGDIYPIGSIYMTIASQDPNAMFSGTKWEKIAGGTALLTANDDTYKAGSVYGSNEQKIKRENLPAEQISISTNASGNHTHQPINFLDEIGFDVTNGGGGDPEKLRMAMGDNSPWSGIKRQAVSSESGEHTHTGHTENLGSGTAMNVMQASLAINVWKRTA